MYSAMEFRRDHGDDAPMIALDIVVDVGVAEAWEWERFVVLRNPATGDSYTISGWGCSCNVLFQDVKVLADLGAPMTFHQAAARAQEWEAEDESETDRREGAAARIIERLMAAR